MPTNYQARIHERYEEVMDKLRKGAGIFKREELLAVINYLTDDGNNEWEEYEHVE